MSMFKKLFGKKAKTVTTEEKKDTHGKYPWGTSKEYGEGLLTECINAEDRARIVLAELLCMEYKTRCGMLKTRLQDFDEHNKLNEELQHICILKKKAEELVNAFEELTDSIAQELY